MSFDDPRFSGFQDAIKRKISELCAHQEPKSFEGQSLGGKVSVKLLLSNFLEYKVKEVRVDPSLLSEKACMLEDLIKAAFDDAFKKSMEHSKGFVSSLMSFYF